MFLTLDFAIILDHNTVAHARLPINFFFFKFCILCLGSHGIIMSLFLPHLPKGRDLPFSIFALLFSADPPRKRVDVVPLSQVNGTPRLSLGNLTEGSPLAPRRALTVQQM